MKVKLRPYPMSHLTHHLRGVGFVHGDNVRSHGRSSKLEQADRTGEQREVHKRELPRCV